MGVSVGIASGAVSGAEPRVLANGSHCDSVDSDEGSHAERELESWDPAGVRAE